MEYVILKHKTLPGHHGYLSNGTLFRTGDNIAPQLFSKHVNIEWVNAFVKKFNHPYVKSLNDFEIVKVKLVEIKN